MAQIPPSGGLSSEEKDKIVSSVYAGIPKIYVRSLPRIEERFFGAMQSLVLDVSLFRNFLFFQLSFLLYS